MSADLTLWGHVVYQADRLAWCLLVVLGAIIVAPFFAAQKLREMWPARRHA